MAARTRRGTLEQPWDKRVRDRIKTSMLLNRMHEHILGRLELSPTQVRCIEIALRKSLPDLSAVEHTGPDGGALTIEVVRFATPVLELKAVPASAPLPMISKA